MKMRFVLLIAAALGFASAASAAELNFQPLKWNGIYAVGEKAGWTVTPTPGVTATYSYRVFDSGAVEIGKGMIDPAKGPAEIAVTLDHPAMIYVTIDRIGAPKPGQPSLAEAAQINTTLKAVVAKKDPALKPILAKYPELCLLGEPCATPPTPAWLPPIQAHFAILGAAVAPTKLAPAAPRPADFDAFWAAKLAALAKVPTNPVLTEIPAPMPGIKFYKVKLDSLGSHVQGYLAVPTTKGPHPAMIQYQWAGVYALIPWNCANRAAEGWLCLNVSSHDMPPDTAVGAPANYPEVGNTSRETSYFLNMYLRDTRALDWLRTRPDWNKKTLVITGASMGGQQSLVTAGLNPGKVTAVIVNQPAGADSGAALSARMVSYPNWAMTNPDVAKTAPYFDTANFTPKITAPTVAAVGFIDSVCTPTSIFAAVNRIPAPHEVVVMAESEHGNYTPDKQGSFMQRAEEIFAVILHGGTLVPDETVTKAK